MSNQAAAEAAPGAYQVLARKYRPQDFSALIGQQAMVRTLSNAIAAGRLAHAFVLTGVRGIGKTTTARIIAKGLNCQNSEGPTTEPCLTCESCVAIAEGRSVDVLEMDAASHTGVGDVREIIDSVRYAPVSGRFKIYIIDEVHMLSNSAFNALLKTLEEPPPHVKFIFATTEIRKLPVTVLSRCQRFDLKRVEADVLGAHLKNIAEREGATLDDEALAMIVRASEGSVRDSLSLLDQAIAHGGELVSAEHVRDMLGVADRAQVMDMFQLMLGGKPAEALEVLARQYQGGADPVSIVGDLLEIAHWLTRLKVSPEAGTALSASEAERVLGGEMAAALSMPVLARVWQVLLKGLAEVRTAPSAIAAAEMLILRIAHMPDMPTPDEVIRALEGGRGNAQAAPPSANASAATNTSTGTAPSSPSSAPPSSRPPSASPPSVQPQPRAGSHEVIASAGSAAAMAGVARQPHADEQTDAVPPHAAALEASPAPQAEVISFPSAENEPAGESPPHPLPSMPTSYEALVDMMTGQVRFGLRNRVRLVSFQPGALVLSPVGDRLGGDFVVKVRQALSKATGHDWSVTLSDGGGLESGGPKSGGLKSLKEQEDAAAEALRDKVMQDPAVQAMLDVFPGAVYQKVVPVVTRAAQAPEDSSALLLEPAPAPQTEPGGGLKMANPSPVGDASAPHPNRSYDEP